MIERYLFLLYSVIHSLSWSLRMAYLFSLYSVIHSLWMSWSLRMVYIQVYLSRLTITTTVLVFKSETEDKCFILKVPKTFNLTKELNTLYLKFTQFKCYAISFAFSIWKFGKKFYVCRSSSLCVIVLHKIKMLLQLFETCLAVASHFVSVYSFS